MFSVKYILDLIYPLRCQICQTRQDPDMGSSLCCDCALKLQRNQPPFCKKCGRSLLGARGPQTVCYECSFRKLYFERAWSCYIYDGLTKECVKLLKYKKRVSLGKPLSGLMLEFFNRNMKGIDLDMIVPVPLSKKRLIQREFNQAELLSENISKGMGLDISSDNLIKRRNTSSQSDLPRRERLRNLQSAFCVRRPYEFRGKKILLIDDVITTCATINESSKTLIEAGSGKVYALSLARGA